MVRKAFAILTCVIFLNSFAASATAQDVKTFLKNLEDAIHKMDTYRYIMLTENWKGRKHRKNIIKFYFKKPNLIRTDVLGGKKKGSTVVLNKKGKIRGRNSWGLKKTLKPTDKRLKNIRGSTFLNASLLDKIKRLNEHILKRGCSAVVAEEDYAEGRAYHLHIDHEDEDDPVTGEDIWFDKENFVILKNLKYEGQKKVSDITWNDFEINIPLDDALFDI